MNKGAQLPHRGAAAECVISSIITSTMCIRSMLTTITIIVIITITSNM